MRCSGLDDVGADLQRDRFVTGRHANPHTTLVVVDECIATVEHAVANLVPGPVAVSTAADLGTMDNGRSCMQPVGLLSSKLSV